jgi:lambda repressor-like predicted transcriptional regulator
MYYCFQGLLKTACQKSTIKKEEVAMSAEERYRFIRSEMVRKGVSNVSISRAAQVSKQRVHDVLKSVRKGYRIRQVVAEKCGLPVEYLWPDTPEEFRHAA